ncbi:MAG: chemotaxis protein [Methylobacter sp.]|nr:MAG: chemotaxis protein [Methylobacter sp.]
MLVISLTGICLGLGIAIYLTRYLSKQLGIDPYFAKGIAMEIAGGNLSQDIQVKANDNSSLLCAMKHMQKQLLERITAERKVSDENLRVKIALDNVSTGVMIADNERNIIYVNQELINMLGKSEVEIGRQLSKFSINGLVGTNMDELHKNPSHQANMLTSLTGPYEANLLLGGRSMVVIANPVINDQGQRLGTVAEWHDRTDELMAKNEVAAIVSAAAMGDFSMRCNLKGKEGFFLHLGEDINQLMQTSESGLNEVVRVLNALSRGDLTETITNDYAGIFEQLKNDSNTTVEKLKGIISQIKNVAEGIYTGTKEIASGNNDLSHRTEEQAASLEETAASMQELTSTVHHNTENAKQANALAVNATNVSGKGVQVVGQVVETMESIHESSRKVVEIISVIDSIAFQTNILALNAAVEAARAGEQGRGFAVVAGEVRNLAQRAAAAAGEIKNLIGNSVEQIEDGTRLVTQAGKTMEEIVNSIHGVTAIMSEIASASVQQTAGIEQVNLAIGQMDDVTQQNAALVEQAAAAAESLEEQTQQLTSTIGQFKVDNRSDKVAAIQRSSTILYDSVLEPVLAKSQEQTMLAGNAWEEF